jgi:DNA helicase HerA-like ATPase
VASNTVGTILGPKGCGKSHLVREIVREQRRVVILDYVGEYGADVGATASWGFDDSLAALERASRMKEFRLSLRDVYDRDRLDLLGVLFELEKFLLVVEEASTLCTPGTIPKPLERIVAIGRHRSISQIYVAQRPSMIHRLVTSQSDFVVAFQQTEPIDVAYLTARFGSAMERVRDLELHDFIVGGKLDRAPAALKRRARALAGKKS